MSRTVLAGILLCLWPAAALEAADTISLPWQDPDSLEWDVVFRQWTAEDLPSDLIYLTRSLPLQIMEAVDFSEDHVLSPEEQEAFSQKRREEMEVQLLKKAVAARRAWDRSALKGDAGDPLASREKGWKEARQRVDLLSGETPPRVESIPLKRQFFKEGQPLYPEGKPVEAEWVFRGTMAPLGEDYYRYSLHLESFLQDEPILLWQDAGRAEDAGLLAAAAAAAVTGVIRGREQALLSVAVEPSSSEIYWQGEFLDVGGLENRPLNPGEGVLEIRAEGYLAHREELTLLPGKTIRREIVLEGGTTRRITIETDPPGAQVYQGSLWLGETPLERDFLVQEEPLIIRLEREGYFPENVIIAPGEGELFFLTLKPQTEDPAQHLAAAEQHFYKNLGFFVISSFLPVVFNGLYQNYEALYVDTLSEDARQKGLFYYYSYGVSLTFSGALLVNTLITLRDYLEAAEDYVR